ncbi:MAG TPA: heparan-alpha-glucosaminide N-acetyltransferase domain-containing protein [Vicinamibacterales bacterium]
MILVRRAYIDWLRGVAVMIMLIAHATDAWTRDDERRSLLWYWRDVMAGFGAPLFLLLAGVAVAYSAAAKLRRGDTDHDAARQVAIRGWQIFGIAFLFRLQLYVTSVFYRWRSLLKVDILNIMGPSIAGAAWIWGRARTTAGKTLALLVPVAVLPIATPYVRGSAWLAALPDPIEAYVRPAGEYANFTLFPWAAFVFVGAAIGVVLERAADSRAEARRVWVVTATGAAVAALSWAASFQPSPFPNSHFWTTSPAFFFLRAGIMTAAFGLAWLWSERLWAGRWQPLVLFGQTSLFVYWVHVELVYGYLTKPLSHRLSLAAASAGVVLLTVAMYYLAKSAKAWIARKREARISDWRTKALTVMGL